ncbi:ABC transporter permease, partial [Streptosporangium roseum]
MNGTWTLTKLALKRERFVVPLWLVLLVALAAGQVQRYATGIPDIAAFAREMAANQALTAFAGEIPSATLAGMAVWKNADAIYTILGLIMILTVVRHSRGEEESGRAELVGAGVVGRLAPLTAALAVACGSAVLAGLLTAAAMAATGAGAAGSLAFGAAIAAARRGVAGKGA